MSGKDRVDPKLLAPGQKPEDVIDYTDDEVKKKNWTGYKMISSGGRIILYQKIKEIDGTYESLDISTEELIDYTVGESVIRMGG